MKTEDKSVEREALQALNDFKMELDREFGIKSFGNMEYLPLMNVRLYEYPALMNVRLYDVKKNGKKILRDRKNFQS